MFCHVLEESLKEFVDKNSDVQYLRFCRERILILKHDKAKDLKMSLILQNYSMPDLLTKSDLELLSTKEELEIRNKEAEWNLISKQIDFYKVFTFCYHFLNISSMLLSKKENLPVENVKTKGFCLFKNK